MDTGVDNTANPNLTSNNTIDLFDVYQKHPAPPDFKSNGTAANNQSDLFYFDRPTNGKRPAEHFEDEEDDDFGPETDIDAIDDVVMSPTFAQAKALVEANANNNPMEMVKKVDVLDVDLELQRQQSSEFEPLRECREETPTPPADSVLDSSGLADNVAESGEDSEDEWNYYKVDPKQKENNPAPFPQESNNKISTELSDAENDDMSQLNPDAKEFVPVSPTRTAVSPAPNFNPGLLDDPLVARSPRRAVVMDIDVPSPVEFQSEMKQRPSELFDDFKSDIESQNQNGHQLSSQERMQNLLNGKDVSDIEFRPSKVSGNIFDDENLKENHSPVDDQPVVPLSPVCSPVEDVPDFTTGIVPKESDPMSMSFYQEEGNDFGTNPFDLNKVQLIPDNIEEIVESCNVNEEIISSESQLGSVEKSPVDSGLSPIDNDICELPKTPVLDEICNLSKTPVLDELCNLPVTPVLDEVCNLSKTPVMDELCNLPKTPVMDEVYNLSKTPVLDEVCNFPKSPIQEDESCFISKSPLLDETCSMSKSPVHSDVYSASPVQNVCELPKSPSEFSEPRKSPMPDVCDVPNSPHFVLEVGQSPLEYAVNWTHKLDVNLSKLPILDVHSPVELSSPVGPLSPKSPIPELTGLVSPDITASIKDENISGEICVTPKSPALDLEAPIIIPESPISEQLQAFPEVTNVEEVKEVSFEAVSNFFNIEKKQIEDAFCELPKEEAKVEELISDAIQDISSVTETEHKLQDILGTMSNEINDMIDMDNKVTTNLLEDNLIKETEIDQPPKSTAFDSPVDPSEISSFLDRSDVPQVTSPLSPSEEIEKFQTERPELWKCEFPLPAEHQASAPFEIKCETIKPEFPVHTIASPSEESKGTDTPPSTPAAIQEEPELKRGSPEPQKIVEAVEKLTAEKETLVTVAAVAGLATTGIVAAAAAAATTKTAAKPKSASSTSAKKPLPSSKAPTSPTKSLAAPKTTPAARKTISPNTLSTATSRLSASKTPTAKPKPSLTPSTTRTIPAAKSAPKARTPATTPTSKLAEAAKKPLTNGEVKPAPIRRPVPGATLPVKAPPAAPPKTTTSTKPASARPATSATARTSTAAAKPAPRSASANLTAPKPRSATLASKTTNGTSATTKTTTNKVSLSGAAKPASTTAAAAKPKPTSTTASRLRSTLASKTSAKAPDTEKQIKETANKQLSASRTTRTVTSTVSATKLTTAAKKIDTKAPLSSRTTTTRTTTLKSTATGKKPTEVTRTAITKTKAPTAIKPPVQQNGIVDVIQEITTVTNVVVSSEDPQLLKDNSPIVENSNLPPMEIIAD